jgi:hypothetical protein
VVASLAQLRGEGLGDLLRLFDLRSTRVHVPKAMLVGVERAVEARVRLQGRADGSEAVRKNLRACGEGIDRGRDAIGGEAIAAWRLVARKSESIASQ